MIFLEYNAYKSNSKNASSKAKVDISSILHKLGYGDLYNPSKYRLIRIIQQLFAMCHIPNDCCIVIQYPSHLSCFYRILTSLKKCKKIAVIHDIESLRGLMSIDKEIDILNRFDVIICHNDSMRKYLIDRGLSKPLFDIQIFDYLLDDSIEVNTDFNRFSIFFAGNLVKSTFLQKLDLLKGLQFNIYGSEFNGLEKIKDQINVSYRGAFCPEDLIPNIAGGWGLVWDGESLETCSGISGEYLKYNNPHKVSMCIASERPVIIWSKAAMADYIKKKGIGICVNNLFEIYEKINSISESEYNEMLKKVKEEKFRLKSGQNFIESIKKCENILNINRSKVINQSIF